MSMDPNRWIKHITKYMDVKTLHQEKYKLDSNRWISTLPNKRCRYNTLNQIRRQINPGKKYSLTIILFIIGLIFVSVIKNETRNLQKEINNLQASINNLKLDLHQATLDHEVITSPENISRLAKEYLETDLVSYKKSQIKTIKQKTGLEKKNFTKKLEKQK